MTDFQLTLAVTLSPVNLQNKNYWLITYKLKKYKARMTSLLNNLTHEAIEELYSW